MVLVRGGGVQQETNNKAEKQNKGKMRWEKLGHAVPRLLSYYLESFMNRKKEKKTLNFF